MTTAVLKRADKNPTSQHLSLLSILPDQLALLQLRVSIVRGFLDQTHLLDAGAKISSPSFILLLLFSFLSRISILFYSML